MNDETQPDPIIQPPGDEGEGTSGGEPDREQSAPKEKPDVFLTELREGDQPGHYPGR
jgi:hypothetical protein